jgi:hypothetical protein
MSESQRELSIAQQTFELAEELQAKGYSPWTIQLRIFGMVGLIKFGYVIAEWSAAAF